ncbi:MAG: hypothetical protein AVDCRST_MAG93-9423, partial [uncultured Chloroflexia bacterium]
MDGVLAGNRGVKYEFPRRFDITTSPVWDKDGWDGIEELEQGRFEAKIGMY